MISAEDAKMRRITRFTAEILRAFEGASYPYWFKAGTDVAYLDFDFKMLTAAYNYQTGLKDPGGYIHNGTYIEQLLFDSIVAMGATPSVPRP